MKKILRIIIGMIAATAFGLILAHCGSGDDGDHCSTNSDCTHLGVNYRCNLGNKTCECLPSCAGRCCGNDGCGGTCADNCPQGTSCNENFCRCEADITECTVDSDCETLGTNYYCDQTSKTCKCTPDCAGKCCGDDACGGTCENTCAQGQSCNHSTCLCEGSQTCLEGQTQCSADVVQTCNASGIWTDTTDCTISNQVCQNGACQATGTCTQGDRRCSGDTVQTCDANGTWTDTTDCAISNQVCQNGACQATATCNNGDRRCSGDTVQTCDANGTWNDTTYCANEGKVCSLGNCVDANLCPTGQDCVDVTGTGYLGCTDGGYIPSGQTTGCGQDSPCPGNETCMNTSNGNTVCVGNCGTCGTDLLCSVVGDEGTMGCLDLNGFIPANAPADCAQNGCTGNATCWCLNQDCTDSACVANCTVDGPCTSGARCDGNTIVTCMSSVWTHGQDCSINGQVCFKGACASADLCPAGQTCEVLTGETTACLENGNTPANNQTGCGQQTPCNGNFSCWCTDQNCASTVCIENCGQCPANLQCMDITAGDGTGTFACMDNGNIPTDAQAACQTSNDCNGNASCWCLNSECSDTVCLFNCSTPH